jgi:xylulose-5-phosphate/fructose-6-phosphate phosphoketolase
MERQAPLSPSLLKDMHAYWRAANYLSVGQIYLLDNPLLNMPLKPNHIKPRLLGHWGTTPGLNFIYVHLNRIINLHQQQMIYIAGPGHGGPGIVANTWLEGAYTEIYPDIDHSIEGIKKLFRQFSFPGGIPSHTAPETPGSMHEGGELGYALSHAYGAAFDNPDLLVACIVGDGEAETGPLATSWHSNKFLHPLNDGIVLPILHLNGYKINNPTLLARLPREELKSLFEGYGHTPYFVEVGANIDDYDDMHQKMAYTLDQCMAHIRQIRQQAATEITSHHPLTRPRWPMIILRSPKGWTGPRSVDGKKAENYWLSHQVPFSSMTPAHITLLEQWLKSYHPDELFTATGALQPNLAKLAPSGALRMGLNPHVHGQRSQDLRLPNFVDYAVEVSQRGRDVAEATRIMGQFLRDVMQYNLATKNFRIFGPDETTSNRWADIYQSSPKTWLAEYLPEDQPDGMLAVQGRVMEMLSEHTCQGWLEGYLLTGRHGFLNCYEAFVHIVDSMFNQHAKWLKTARHIRWRKPLPSLNYLLTSHVWRQDHNGFSHQDPGFLDHVVNKKADIIRVYLPPDANTLLCVTDHCLRSRHYVNVVVAGKQPALQYLSIDEAIQHCAKGLGIWQWASTDQASEPDIVMACAGDVPTMEALAATSLLQQHFPALKIRFVNVVDLMTLQPQSEHPHGMSDQAFDALFTPSKPILFAFHGYPWLIHRLTYRRHGHNNLHVRGYMEEGTTTTPFDMVVRNKVDRYSLAIDAIDRLPALTVKGAYARQHFTDKLIAHKQYIHHYGEDMPEIANWTWPS